MPRAKAMAGKPPAEVLPREVPEGETLESVPAPDGVEEREIPAPAERPLAPVDVGVAPARSIEAIIRERMANGRSTTSAAATESPTPREPSSAEVRASFRPFQALVLDAAAKDGNYVPAEERGNPEYRENAERERKEREAKNLAKSRRVFGVEPNVKVVFPSQNMGRQAVQHTW